jgi:transcriptional regulator with XRE-family HTH domain
MPFADKFKAARMRAGLSQEKLSAVLGVTARTIGNYESGATLPPSETLALIAKHFGVSIDSLVSEEEEFISEAYEQGGSRSAREAEALVNDVAGLFAGGRLSEDEKDAVMRAIQNAYWVAKEESKRKYTPKKYRGL